mgnify:CR=1 FL=1
MKIKNKISVFLLLAVCSLYAQESSTNDSVSLLKQIKISYLDSIKKTFIKDQIAICIDSLWMKELTSLDSFDNMISDIKNVNVDEKVDYELPTELLKERLKRMDEKSPFNIEYNIGLENVIKSFLKNRKKGFERLMGISQFYFPIFEEELAKNNIPLEIKYLAVVESALNPLAVSRVGATGLWQFMYQTGKQYGLNIDSYVDERSEPLKASQAASQYMMNMYKIFGDWDLVLASYNSGPGNVAKAIRRSGGQQNYWNIRKNLPKETQLLPIIQMIRDLSGILRKSAKIEKADKERVEGILGLAGMVILLQTHNPFLIPRRSFGSKILKLTGYPRDTDDTKDSPVLDILISIMKSTFELSPSTFKGPSKTLFKAVLVKPKEIRKESLKYIDAFVKKFKAQLIAAKERYDLTPLSQEITNLIDELLKHENSDYEAKRYNSISLDKPEIIVAKKGVFYKWMKKRNKLGGQNKIPRLSNSRKYIEELLKLNT